MRHVYRDYGDIKFQMEYSTVCMHTRAKCEWSTVLYVNKYHLDLVYYQPTVRRGNVHHSVPDTIVNILDASILQSLMIHRISIYYQ